MQTPHFYSRHAAAFRSDLGRAIDRETVRRLHTRAPVRHLLVAARLCVLLAAATWGLVSFSQTLVWMPLAVVQGLTIFNFTVLLHEVVHHAVLERPRPALERLLG